MTLDLIGNVYPKEGSLDAGWIREQGPFVMAITAASDDADGPVIGILYKLDYWAKDGFLNAGWTFLKGPLPVRARVAPSG